MIISHSRQFTFVHIHKAGGTSIERALDPYLCWNDLMLGGSELGEKMQASYAKRFGLNKHSTVSEIESVCGKKYIDDYYLFALVRHPVDRLCSIYNYVATGLNKWAIRQNISLDEVKAHITPQAKKKFPPLTWVSSQVFMNTNGFSEFIRHKRLKTAPGFRSQTGMLSGSDGKIRAEVFHLEEYPRWLGTFSERLRLDIELPHANRSGLRLIDPTGVSREDRNFVRDEFWPDYENFGYKP